VHSPKALFLLLLGLELLLIAILVWVIVTGR
jgi:hypothetical protein